MLCENEIKQYKPGSVQKVVCIPNTLYKSLEGIYFIGQTPLLFIGSGNSAWAALVNPKDSGKDLFVNVLTICNYSTDAMITAELWLNTKLTANASISTMVSPSNTALFPKPIPKVKIEYVQSTTEKNSGGVNIFDRIVPPSSTVVDEEDSKIIIPPGGNALLYIQTPSSKIINSRIAFGWSER